MVIDLVLDDTPHHKINNHNHKRDKPSQESEGTSDQGADNG